MSGKETLVIAYNFKLVKELDNMFIPQAIVATAINNTLQFYKKKAVPEVLESFNLPYKGLPHEALLRICNTISLVGLKKKYVTNSKKSNAFSNLISEDKTKKVILQFINYQLSKFFDEIKKGKYYLCCFSQSNDNLGNFQINISNKICLPLLYFKKVNSGIDYTLKLSVDNKIITPINHEIKIIFDEKGWFILDAVLYKLRYVNAKKINPFLKTNTLHIPKKMELSFFKKFVLGISKNTEIITEGFKVTNLQSITNCMLNIYHDFLLDTYCLQVYFWYNEVRFTYDEKQQVKSELTFNNNIIGIKRTCRDNELEEKYINVLTEEGLKRTNKNHFTITQTTDPFGLLEFLSDKQEIFKSKNITICPFEINDKLISFKKKDIYFSVAEKIDWFDINATIEHGNYSFSFLQLKPYIENNERLFYLPDNSFFIIPMEWMHRYKDIFSFGKVAKNQLLLPKSNYTLLETLNIKTSLSIENNDTIHLEIPEELNHILRSYQKEGVKWLLNHYNNNLGACLADDMGLGKTLQTIAVLSVVKKQINTNTQTRDFQLNLFSNFDEKNSSPLCALIIVPASLIFNWKDEFSKFAPHFKVTTYRGKERAVLKNKLLDFDVILTTYQTALLDCSFLKNIVFSYVILDESQYIKNNTSKVFKAINQLSANHKISLSGTTIENGLSDLWSQMEFINPSVLGNYSFFKKNYLIPIEKNNDEETINKLKALINPYILRRTKEEVAKDLPKLSSQVIYVEMLKEQAKIYEKEKSAIRNVLLKINSDKEKLFVINILLRLRKLANHPILFNEELSDVKSGKFLAATAYIETLVKAGKKVLIFSSFVSHLNLYKQWFIEKNIRFNMLTGQTDIKERESLVKDFQGNPKSSVFLISLKAGGTGLNLTAASYVIILDPWWNPFSEKQAIGRAHRIGQKQNVNVVRFICKNTLEEKILVMQNRKNEISDVIIKTDSAKNMSLSELKNLI